MRQLAVFTLLFLGFHVRCALDTSDGSRVRIEKLYDMIRSSRLGIHDLSRTELDAVNSLPRFNMPLELGIFLGVKDSGGKKQKRKVALVTASKPYEYQKYVSDVAGQDVVPHNDDPKLFARAIRDWIASIKSDSIPSASRILERYRQFGIELKSACREARQDPGELTYRDYVKHVDLFCSEVGHTLRTSGGDPRTNPSAHDITSAVRGLSDDPDGFAILAKSGSGLSYMQTALNGPNDYVLEVQEGSTDAHYRCSSPPLNTKSVIKAFTLYAEDDMAWRQQFKWERMDFLS